MCRTLLPISGSFVFVSDGSSKVTLQERLRLVPLGADLPADPFQIGDGRHDHRIGACPSPAR